MAAKGGMSTNCLTFSQLRDLDRNFVSSCDDVISCKLILPISRSSNDLLLTSQMAGRGGSWKQSYEGGVDNLKRREQANKVFRYRYLHVTFSG
jgi:hypothetical protein